MASAFQLSIVAPDRKVVETQVSSVTAPGTEGYLGVMAGHIPMIVSLKPGLLEYRDMNSQEHYVAIDGGFMEINATSVIVLAEGAKLSGDIDLKAAEAELEEARRALRGESSSMSTEEATEHMERALARIKAARLR
ncbi:MAG: ATP synthase F1 subunit epsilon [Armatimonadetes bacterium]|nr:ATP synthase F1 subunit epsilon [Armatimonadota bacterium]